MVISIQHSARFAFHNSHLLGKDKEQYFIFFCPHKILLKVKALKLQFIFVICRDFLYMLLKTTIPKLICVKNFQIFFIKTQFFGKHSTKMPVRALSMLIGMVTPG